VVYPSKVADDYWLESCAFFKAIIKSGNLPQSLLSNSSIPVTLPTKIANNYEFSLPCTQFNTVDSESELLMLEKKIQQGDAAIVTKAGDINPNIKEIHRKAVIQSVVDTTKEILMNSFRHNYSNVIPLSLVFYPFYENVGAVRNILKI